LNETNRVFSGGGTAGARSRWNRQLTGEGDSSTDFEGVISGTGEVIKTEWKRSRWMIQYYTGRHDHPRGTLELDVKQCVSGTGNVVVNSSPTLDDITITKRRPRDQYGTTNNARGYYRWRAYAGSGGSRLSAPTRLEN